MVDLGFVIFPKLALIKAALRKPSIPLRCIEATGRDNTGYSILEVLVACLAAKPPYMAFKEAMGALIVDLGFEWWALTLL